MSANMITVIRQLQHMGKTVLVICGEVRSGKAVKKWLGSEDAIFTYIWVTMVIELKRNPESCDVELVLLLSVPTKIKKLTIHSMYS